MKKFIAMFSGRKGKIVLLGFLEALLLFVFGEIDAAIFLDATLALVGFLVAGIAIEDGALKLKRGYGYVEEDKG